MKNILVCIMLALVTVAASAPPDRKDVRRGNRDFKKGDWKAAEIDYRKALVKDSSSVAANYNLGNTLYRMGDMEQARKSYDALKEVAPSSPAASDLYYNMGNAASQAKDWQAAVDAYKESLLRNPGDMDAKENYIYAKEMLKNQQNQDQNGGNRNQDNQQDQDDKNNQQNQDNKDNQDKNDDQNKDRQNDGNNQDQQDSPQQQPQQGQQPKITPQAAQQMLQAIQEKEKETQEKVKKEKAEALKSRQKEKNW